MTWEVTVATLLSALTVGLAVTAEPNNQNLTCEAGNYAVGEDASVTCLFPRDLGRTMHHIYVTHYPFDAAINITQAMICFRLHTKQVECKVADGYSFNGVVSDNLTLAIPEVRGRFAGRYSCQLVPPEGMPRSTCDLNVNGTALTCQAGNFTEGEMAAVNCFFHKNIENTLHHVYVVRYPYNTTEKSTTALVCFRLHDKQLECKTEEGYSFSGIVSHKLTLEIPKVRKRFAGRYSCQIVPPDAVPLDTCGLHVKGQPSHSTTEQTGGPFSVTTPGGPFSVTTPGGPFSVIPHGDAHDSGLSPTEILLIVILGIVTIVEAFIFVNCVRLRRRGARYPHVPMPEQEMVQTEPVMRRPIYRSTPASVDNYMPLPPVKRMQLRTHTPLHVPGNVAPNPQAAERDAQNQPAQENVWSDEDDECAITTWSDEDDECAITTESEDEENGVKAPNPPSPTANPVAPHAEICPLPLRFSPIQASVRYSPARQNVWRYGDHECANLTNTPLQAPRKLGSDEEGECVTVTIPLLHEQGNESLRTPPYLDSMGPHAEVYPLIVGDTVRYSPPTVTVEAGTNADNP